MQGDEGFKASLGYMRSCLNKKATNNQELRNMYSALLCKLEFRSLALM